MKLTIFLIGLTVLAVVSFMGARAFKKAVRVDDARDELFAAERCYRVAESLHKAEGCSCPRAAHERWTRHRQCCRLRLLGKALERLDIAREQLEREERR